MPELIKPESIELFEKYSIFNERELHSRYEVRLEQYALTIGVEAKLTSGAGWTVILPAAIRYQTELAQNVATLKAAGLEPDMTMLEAVTTPISELTAALTALKASMAEYGGDSAADEAAHARDALLPAMDAVRAAADMSGRHCGRRSLAVAHLSGDAVHPLTDVAEGGVCPLNRATGNRIPTLGDPARCSARSRVRFAANFGLRSRSSGSLCAGPVGAGP